MEIDALESFWLLVKAEVSVHIPLRSSASVSRVIADAS